MNYPAPDRIHIVEPTLASEAGHCHSFVASLCAAGGRGEATFHVYAGARARLPGLSKAGAVIRPYFHRPIRRLEAFFLYRKLLREPGRILVSTAGRADLTILSLASGGRIPARKAFLYFHWVNRTPGKMGFFREAAARQPDLVILGPTRAVTDVFRECGFRDVRLVPYPITPPAAGPAAPVGFRRVLYAGAARSDKGFSFVVDYMGRLAETGADIPVLLQVSGDHHQRYDEGTREGLARLKRIVYPHLSIAPDTVPQSEYLEQFRGAVCLQPYDPEDFRDRVSGVTLDALTAGAPVVVSPGTWMARTVERFDAGRVLSDRSPGAMDAAIRAVIAEYPRFHRNALLAGDVLQRENGADHLFRALTED